MIYLPQPRTPSDEPPLDAGAGRSEALIPLGMMSREELSHELEDRLAEAAERQRAIALLWLTVVQSEGRSGHNRRVPTKSLLRHCAERIAARLGPGDVLAYMGEGDFAVLVGSIRQPGDAVNFARSLLEAFQRPFLDGTAPLYADVDVGVAVHPNDGELPVRLLHAAQQAAHRAAATLPQRRTRLAFSSDTLHSQQQRYEQICEGLSSALAREEFALHYQPMLYLPGDSVAAVEALIRWDSNELGRIPPDEFIPTAERSGEIVEIGKWVLMEACRQARTWERGGMPVRVAVNLSARQLQEPDLTTFVSGVLEDTGLDPALLELELTESMYAEPDTAIAVLKRLHELGVRVSIDDFGTGFSSLSYLACFPRDTLKIDRSFIAQTTHDNDVAAVVGSVIVMAHALGVETVAEGVETEEHLSFLMAHNCDLSQGYLHSPPLPATEIESWLRSHRSARSNGSLASHADAHTPAANGNGNGNGAAIPNGNGNGHANGRHPTLSNGNGNGGVHLEAQAIDLANANGNGVQGPGQGQSLDETGRAA